VGRDPTRHAQASDACNANSFKECFDAVAIDGVRLAQAYFGMGSQVEKGKRGPCCKPLQNLDFLYGKSL
jgi:hypothetical protein